MRGQHGQALGPVARDDPGLRAGVALPPAGKRRGSLHEYLEKRVLPSFAGRVLPFDLACTSAYAGPPA